MSLEEGLPSAELGLSQRQPLTATAGNRHLSGESSAQVISLWRGLQQRNGRLPTTGVDWHTASSALHYSQELTCVSLGTRRQLRAVAPLARERINGIEHLGSLRILLKRIASLGHPLLEQALQIEGASWKSAAGTALLRDPVRLDFFSRYAELAARQGTLRLAFLHLRDRPAAMQLAVESHSALWLLNIGYDAQFAACSPGQLLMREVIAHAAERRLNRVEFLGSVSPWTQAWTRDRRQCLSLWLYPLSLRSLAQIAQSASRRLLGSRR